MVTMVAKQVFVVMEVLSIRMVSMVLEEALAVEEEAV